MTIKESTKDELSKKKENIENVLQLENEEKKNLLESANELQTKLSHLVKETKSKGDDLKIVIDKKTTIEKERNQGQQEMHEKTMDKVSDEKKLVQIEGEVNSHLESLKKHEELNISLAQDLLYEEEEEKNITDEWSRELDALEKDKKICTEINNESFDVTTELEGMKKESEEAIITFEQMTCERDRAKGQCEGNMREIMNLLQDCKNESNQNINILERSYHEELNALKLIKDQKNTALVFKAEELQAIIKQIENNEMQIQIINQKNSFTSPIITSKNRSGYLSDSATPSDSEILNHTNKLPNPNVNLSPAKAERESPIIPHHYSTPQMLPRTRKIDFGIQKNNRRIILPGKQASAFKLRRADPITNSDSDVFALDVTSESDMEETIIQRAPKMQRPFTPTIPTVNKSDNHTWSRPFGNYNHLQSKTIRPNKKHISMKERQQQAAKYQSYNEHERIIKIRDSENVSPNQLNRKPKFFHSYGK